MNVGRVTDCINFLRVPVLQPSYYRHHLKKGSYDLLNAKILLWKIQKWREKTSNMKSLLRDI